MKSIIVKALALLTGASRSVLEFIMPILKDSASRLLADLLPIALEVVSSLADSKRSGDEKRKAAFTRIQLLARAQGIQVATSAINLAIELAVQRTKEK